METDAITNQINKHSFKTLKPPSYGDILRFTLPLILGLLTNAINTLIDTLFIGQLGTAQLAAVPLAATMYLFGWVFIAGLLRNSIAFIGHAFGSKEYSKIGIVLAHYQFLSLFALPILILFIQTWPLFSAIANLDSLVDNYAWIYLKIRFWDAPFSLLLILYSSFYQALGNSRLPMLVFFVVLLTNVVLDYGLIFGHFGLPALGVEGSALATVLANLLGALIIIFTAFLSKSRLTFNLRLVIPIDWPLLKNLLRIGIPQGVGDCLEILTWLGLFLIVGQLGQVALAANNIGVQVIHLLFLPGMAMGTAAASYMARFIGAGQPDMAQITIFRILKMGIVYMGTLGIPLWFFGESIAGWFTTDKAVIYQAALMFKVMALFQSFDAMVMILRSALAGAKDTLVPTLLLVACTFGIMFPTAFVLSRLVEPGLVGAWLGALAYLVIFSLMLRYRFQKNSWR
jgi:multidrug resistance protein, MATE family